MPMVMVMVMVMEMEMAKEEMFFLPRCTVDFEESRLHSSLVENFQYP